MSKSRKPKTKDLLIEICPECNAIHSYALVGGLIEGIGKAEIQCGFKIGEKPPERKKSESEPILKIGEKPPERKKSEPQPILCDYVIKPTEGEDGNLYAVRRWSFRERQEFYRVLGAYDQRVTPGRTVDLKVHIAPEVMDFAILHGVVKSPVPLKTKEDLDDTDLDGAVLEALYSEVLDYNTPPLAPSSALRRRFTRRTRSSAGMIS